MNGNLAYQEERREELIDGEVVAMSPRQIKEAVNYAQMPPPLVLQDYPQELKGENNMRIAMAQMRMDAAVQKNLQQTI